MREVKLCYRELQGLRAHFRQIKNKNSLAVKTAQQSSVVLQKLLRQSKGISPTGRQQQKNADSNQPDTDQS